MNNSVSILAATHKDIPVINDIAEKTWWPTYSPILSQEQIRYMLDTLYNAQALATSMQEGKQTYLVIYDNQVAVGFASYGPRKEDPSIVKLYKIYVLPQTHGKGYGKKLIHEITSRLLNEGIHVLELNVNRYNKAKTFYENLGFKVIREEDIPIGPYWMNDYVMQIRF